MSAHLRPLRSTFSMLAVLSIGAGLGAACGSSTPSPTSPPTESSASPATKKLDCAFLKGGDNCWKILAATVSACLNGHVHPQGKLTPDLGACSLEDEVKVKLGQPCDPDKECEPRDVFMGRGDKKCMEFHSTVTKPADEMGRGAGTFEIAAADGTVKVEYDEKTKTLTCPNGTVYSGSGDWKKELADCNDESGFANMPAYAFTKTATVMDGKKKKPGTGTLSFELASIDVLFECAKP